MNTVLLETKQDYIDYCIANDVFNTSQKYGSQYTNIDGGIDHDLYDAIDIEPDSICISRKYITSEPMSYPCIFTWTCIDIGNPEYRGEFIYPQDFEYMKRYGNK